MQPTIQPTAGKRSQRLTWDLVTFIRECSAEITTTELARVLGVSHSTVRQVRTFQTWKQRPMIVAIGELAEPEKLDPRCRRLTADHVARIRQWWGQGWSRREIARTIGVSTVTVWHITSGKTWRASA